MIIQGGIAVLSAAVGVGLASTSTLLAQTDAIPGGGDLATWGQSGGTVLAVGAITYIARMFARGDLVHKDSARSQAQLEEHIRTLETLTDRALTTSEQQARVIESLMARPPREKSGP